MKIIINTFENAPQERLDNANTLLQTLTEAGADAEIFTGGTNLVQNIVDIANIYKDTDILLIEDDVQLCTDFLQEIQNAIEVLPNRVINFHYNERSVSKISVLASSRYAYNQCVYLPRHVLLFLTQYSSEFLRKYPVYSNDSARYISFVLNACLENFVVYRPELVKHLQFDSTLTGSPRIETYFFKDEVQ
jgi:hypothetical protein